MQDLSPAPATPDAATRAPRLDLYAPIHKALRYRLCDTLVQVGRIDADDDAALRGSLERLDALLDMCEAHVHHENRFVHPAIEARAPAASARIAAEHDEHLDAIAELRGEAVALRRAGAAERAPLALRLYRHLALFVAHNLEHMHIEETALNAALWAHYDDAELLALHQRLLASLDPGEHLEVARWMWPALSPGERAAVAAEMQREAPPEAFMAVLRVVRPHLGAPQWHHLARSIALPELAAAG